MFSLASSLTGFLIGAIFCGIKSGDDSNVEDKTPLCIPDLWFRISQFFVALEKIVYVLETKFTIISYEKSKNVINIQPPSKYIFT